MSKCRFDYTNSKLEAFREKRISYVLYQYIIDLIKDMWQGIVSKLLAMQCI